MKALIWFPTRIICSDLCLNCKPITQNYRQDVHKICISRDFLCLHCLWNLRFESNLPGSIPKILKSDRDSKALEPDPESWRFWVESNLTSRDSLRGLVKIKILHTEPQTQEPPFWTMQNPSMEQSCDSYLWLVKRKTKKTSSILFISPLFPLLFLGEGGEMPPRFARWPHSISTALRTVRWFAEPLCRVHGVLGNLSGTTGRWILVGSCGRVVCGNTSMH